MKGFVLTILIAFSLSGFAQNITFGGMTTFKLGASTSFFAGGNTTFNGTINNEGTIISYNDLDFVNNITVGNLRFVGINDQNLLGDSIVASNIEVDKVGDLILLTNQVIVEGNLDVTMGVIQAEEEDDLLVTGSSASSGGVGYVEGKLVGLTTNQPVTFPMGVNGSPNFITLTNADPGIVLRVEIQVPDTGTLYKDEETIVISDEVEWVITSLGDSTQVQISVNFSGVDLTDFPIEDDIQADLKEPAIVMFFEEDTLHHPLTTTEVSNLDTRDRPSSGTIVTSDMITISSDPKRFAVAWIPVVDGPEFFVPNSFAPDAFYEENRVFRPFFVGAELTSISFRVFDALNKEVYSFNQSGENLDISLIGWDGDLPSGQQAEAGVYYYSATLIADGIPYRQAGSVLLVK